MTWVFSFAQHLPFNRAVVNADGKPFTYGRCIICWEKLGIVSRKMTKEEWLAHVNEHFTSGGFRMCKDSGGIQIRKSACGKQSCDKIHSGG
jgi:hypothetical protein